MSDILRFEVYDVITYITLRWSHHLRHYPYCVVRRSKIKHYSHALYKEKWFVKLNFTTYVEFYVSGIIFMVRKYKFLLVVDNQPW